MKRGAPDNDDDNDDNENDNDDKRPRKIMSPGELYQPTKEQLSKMSKAALLGLVCMMMMHQGTGAAPPPPPSEVETFLIVRNVLSIVGDMHTLMLGLHTQMAQVVAVISDQQSHTSPPSSSNHGWWAPPTNWTAWASAPWNSSGSSSSTTPWSSSGTSSIGYSSGVPVPVIPQTQFFIPRTPDPPGACLGKDKGKDKGKYKSKDKSKDKDKGKGKSKGDYDYD